MTGALPSPAGIVDGVDLDHHGDRDARPGLLDLAVNVRATPPPRWLSDAVSESLGGIGRYPDPRAATAAVAARHRRAPEEVLLTSGAAEAFGLLARTIRPAQAVVVHPQFSEPERALRVAGHPVHRHLLRQDEAFLLVPGRVPADADLVVVGNPTNPTGVLHRAEDLLALAAPGRTLVVDEAFMDAVPGEGETLAGRSGVPGLVVVRSLTKAWGLPGLRVGYLLAEPDAVTALRRAQQPWPVSVPALAAATVCVGAAAQVESQARARQLSTAREELRGELLTRGLACVPGSRAPFLLVRGPAGGGLVAPLRAAGVAVRSADGFPGLGPHWFRTAVREDGAHRRLVDALDRLAAAGVGGSGSPGRDGGR